MNIDKSISSVKIYDKIAQQYAAVFDTDETDNIFLDKFLTHVGAHSKILDLGCGTGRITKYIADKGHNVIGIDLSEKMLDIARRKYPHIEFKQSDIRLLDHSQSYDAVSFAYALFHLNPDEGKKILNTIFDILSPHGILLLIVQEGEGEKWIDEPFSPEDKLYLKLYTEQELHDLLSNIGFKILEVDRKAPRLDGEPPFNKLFFVAQK